MEGASWRPLFHQYSHLTRLGSHAMSSTAVGLSTRETGLIPLARAEIERPLALPYGRAHPSTCHTPNIAWSLIHHLQRKLRCHVTSILNIA